MAERGSSSRPEAAAPGGVVVVGPGRMGQSLAAALADAGRRVSVRGRQTDPPAFLAGRPGVRYGRGVPSSPASSPTATLVFCVPDDALPEAADAWAGEGFAGRAEDPGEASPVALHTSGVHAADVLSPLRTTGWSVAAWHPLTALAGPRADAFRGVTFAVAGDETAEGRAQALTGSLGGRTVRVAAGEHARYHAAAVFASNFLVACLSVAARQLEEATGGGGADDLLPLARAAIENLEDGGLAAGATGPLTRGDVDTVRRHLQALDGETAGLYRKLARELLTLVEGRLEPSAARRLREALAPPRHSGGDTPGGGAADGAGT